MNQDIIEEDPAQTRLQENMPLPEITSPKLTVDDLPHRLSDCAVCPAGASRTG